MSRTFAGMLGCALVALTLGTEAVSAQGRGNQAPPQLVTPADAEGFIVVTPEALAASFSTGTGRQRVLYGNPSQPGLYVVQLVWEPGSGSTPHTHNEARLINVLEGTWYVATGEAARTYNPDGTRPVTAGTFIYEPADGVHYDMSKDERVVVQIMGIGPVRTTGLPHDTIPPRAGG
jgi:quercetin dioxygenase-like cupin family protein